MATYQNLKDRVQLLIDRDDATAQVAATSGNTLDILDDCINRAERRAYRSGGLMLPPFEKEIGFTVEPGIESLPIPNGFFAIRWATCQVGDRRVVLERRPAEELDDKVISRQVGIPSRIAYGSNRWLIDAPSQPVTINVKYYGELAKLSTVTSEDTSHWLLDYADDYIMYLAAVESALYFDTIDANLAAAWEGKATEIIDSIRKQYVDQLESGSRLRWGQATPRPTFYSAGRSNY